MYSSTSVMSSKGQVVIPAAFRKALKLTTGTRIAFLMEKGRLVLEADPWDALLALEGTVDAPALQWLEEEKAAERALEDRKFREFHR